MGSGKEKKSGVGYVFKGQHLKSPVFEVHIIDSTLTNLLKIIHIFKNLSIYNIKFTYTYKKYFFFILSFLFHDKSSQIIDMQNRMDRQGPDTFDIIVELRYREC